MIDFLKCLFFICCSALYSLCFLFCLLSGKYCFTDSPVLSILNKSHYKPHSHPAHLSVNLVNGTCKCKKQTIPIFFPTILCWHPLFVFFTMPCSVHSPFPYAAELFVSIFRSFKAGIAITISKFKWRKILLIYEKINICEINYVIINCAHNTV